MKIELDNDDIKEIMNEIYPIKPTDKDFKIALVEVAIDRMACDFKKEYLKNFNENIYGIYGMLNKFAYDIAKEHTDEIIDAIVDNVSKKILEKKKIKDEMPKASEIKTIYKEWEDMFKDMVNNAIKKKFS